MASQRRDSTAVSIFVNDAILKSLFELGKSFSSFVGHNHLVGTLFT
ncbi:MAG: hypothetical protein HZC38_02530 [Chloroflexi bacterium]|nr:hypothetical protein [Chloroflexota bacterium]